MADARVLAWWLFLCAVSVANLSAWSVLARRRGAFTRAQAALSAVFVAGCAFRSFLPRTEARKLCLFDWWICDAPIARVVATLAELAFVAQVALLLHLCARKAGSTAARRISLSLVPLIAAAEVFSWYSALTTNFFGSVLEESTWVIAFALALLGFALVRGHFSPPVERALRIAMLFAAGYLLFMCAVDVPMYWRRFLADQSRGAHYLSLADGWRDGWQRRVVTWRWEDWREEMPWMTLYFSAAVWISLAMAFAPRAVALAAPQVQRTSDETMRVPLTNMPPMPALKTKAP